TPAVASRYEIAVVPKPARTEVVDLVRTFAPLLNHDERVGVGNRHGAQDERFDGTQHHGRRAEPDGENGDDGQAECRRLFDRAQGEAQVGVEPGKRADDSFHDRRPWLLTLATLGGESLD